MCVTGGLGVQESMSKGAEKPQKTLAQLQWARFQQIRKYNKQEKNSMVG